MREDHGDMEAEMDRNGLLPYEAPVLRELPVRETLTGPLSLSAEAFYTSEGDGFKVGDPAGGPS